MAKDGTEIINVAISEIVPNPDNPRSIRDEKFKKLVSSLKSFPDMMNKRPIVVNKDMVVLGGNMRLRAAEEAGLTKVPIIVTNWNKKQQREFIIKDNVGFGEWDFDMLANEWGDEPLEEWGLDVPTFKEEDTEEDNYQAPDEIQTNIVPGDLIEIGPHRLLCGDSTISDQVEKLLQGKEPYMMVTDPPYGVDYDPEWRAEAGVNKNNKKMGKVNNDDIADWSDTWSLSPSKVAYVWHAGIHASTFNNP